MSILRKLQRIKPAALRHIFARNARPYERILQRICASDELWVTSQGDYIQWWREREAITLTIHVADGKCHVRASSPRAAIEQFPGAFLESESIDCPHTTFKGDCLITIDSAMQHKETLIEILRREGILNYRVAEEGEVEGDFLLSSDELDPLLEQAKANWIARKSQPDPRDIRAVRKIVIEKLAAANLPLLRVWYHPRVKGKIAKAVFSPRYDIDRAITNTEGIRALEMKYGVDSTFYIRAFCPFYSDQHVEALAAMPWCPEIALHGEFVTNARQYGDEMAAALAEKRHLEKLIQAPVRGMGMHGGELTDNRTKFTNEATAAAALLYDTTTGPFSGSFLPHRMIINGKYSNVYGLPHALSDVAIEANRRYGQELYERAVETMQQIYEENGVFVFMMHPEYFGFFAYLSKPANLLALLRYLVAFIAGEQKTQTRAGTVAATEN